MKKKLVAGLGLITLIFVISGIFILRNLENITTNHELKEHQEKVLSRYSTILYNIKSAQAELYRHQAGFSRDIDGLVEYVLQLDDLLSLTNAEYADYLSSVECNQCHSVLKKVDSLQHMISELNVTLSAYKQKISLIVTLRDDQLAREIEKEATADGDQIIGTVDHIRHAAEEMNEDMEKFHSAAITRSKYSIIAAVLVSIALAGIVIVIVIQSITGPVNVLVWGIEKVSSGDYGSRVDIQTSDEIGFLAKTFNSMTENLEKTTRQKDMLMIELKELNDDLERRVQEATEELKRTHETLLRNETLSVVGTFASGVAHELATPFSSLVSYVQMVRRRVAGQDTLEEDMVLIEKELQRCRGILRGMLDFARPAEREKVPTDVSAIIRELLALVRYQTEYKSVRFHENLASDIPSVMAIPGQIKQVFMNITVNALQSMPHGGELLVSTSLDPDHKRVVIAISDTGGGIPQNEVGKIFQPFYTSKKEGTGLGLSISYGIMKAHGGDIQVKSSPGTGTTFFISLPVPETKSS